MTRRSRPLTACRLGSYDGRAAGGMMSRELTTARSEGGAVACGEARVGKAPWRYRYFTRLTRPVQSPMMAVHSSRKEGARHSPSPRVPTKRAPGDESRISAYPAVAIGTAGQGCGSRSSRKPASQHQSGTTAASQSGAGDYEAVVPGSFFGIGGGSSAKSLRRRRSVPWPPARCEPVEG
jgi:hypothetical protein